MSDGTICKRCAWAKWEKTSSGRIKRHVCGRCTFSLKEGDIPKVPPHWQGFLPSVSSLNQHGRDYGIWPDRMPDCPCFKEKETP